MPPSDSAPPVAESPIRTASHPATNDAAFRLVVEATAVSGGGDARVLDLGCGRGHLARRIGRHFDAAGRRGADQVLAADLCADAYEAREIPFRQVDFNRPLPFEDAAFDVVYSVEVAEHLHRPYDVLKECARILKPGGVLVLSTPNVLHATSRMRFFWTGFFDLYQPPSTDPANGGRICGHVMPLSQPYFDYGLKLAGFEDVRYSADKTKRGATALWLLLWPAFFIAERRFRRAVRRYDAAVELETRDSIARTFGRTTMTSRSLLFTARRPS